MTHSHEPESEPHGPPWPHEQHLVHFLQEHGAECPRCRYNLHRLTSPYCPECGAELRLTVGTVEPYLRAWVTLVVSLCVGAGQGAIWVLVLTKQGAPPPQFLVTIVCGISCIPIMIAAVLTRKRFVRLTPRKQWILAACAVMLTAVALVSFLLPL